MLILTRKEDEEIIIGESIRVKVVAMGDGQVKLGIEAPQEVRVYRREVYEQILRQNFVAARTRRSLAVSAARRIGK